MPALSAEDVLARGAAIGLPDPDRSPPLDFRAWPGAERRWPPVTHHSLHTMRPLVRGLAAAVARDIAPRGTDQAVLDLGCGDKPFLPYFAAVAREYVGVDVAPGPQVDVVAPAETLPFPDGRFDVVLCTQVLEHVLDPPAVLREIHRVLRPGGVALVSTHGTAAYHPHPTDLWRWTQEGLVKVVRDSGEWATVDLHPAGGTLACFGFLLSFYLAGALDRKALAPLRRALIAVANTAFGALDRAVPLHYPRRYTLISNFLAVARKTEAP